MLNHQGIREFRPPRESLEKTLENTRPKRNYEQNQQDAAGVKVKSSTQQQAQEGSGSASLEQAVAASAAAAALAADAMSTPSTGELIAIWNFDFGCKIFFMLWKQHLGIRCLKIIFEP